jgi:hypothetical protein
MSKTTKTVTDYHRVNGKWKKYSKVVTVTEEENVYNPYQPIVSWEPYKFEHKDSTITYTNCDGTVLGNVSEDNIE